MTQPRVEAQFDGATWTDISGWVEQLEFRRGRAGDLAQVEAGSGRVVLWNQDGRFTPQNSQGAYSPDVLPGVPVRVSVPHDEYADAYSDLYGELAMLFVGEAQRWEPSWTVRGDALVHLDMLDGFERLRNVDLPWASNVFIRANSPDAYWPLSDLGGVQRDYSGNSRDMTVVAGDVGQGSLVTGGDGAVRVTEAAASLDSACEMIRPPDSWWATSNDVTVSAWIRFDTTADTLRIIILSSAALNENQWLLMISSGRMMLAVTRSGTDDFALSDILTWNVGQTYHVGMFWDNSLGQVTFYRDGNAVTTVAAPTPPDPDPKGRAVLVEAGGNVGDEYTGGEVAFWTSDQSALMSDLHAAGRGFASDSPFDRITRVLDWAGWDATARNLDVGTTPLAGIPGGGSALAECLAAAAADGGVFYIAKDGAATFQGRRTRWETDNVVLFTFDDDGTDTPYDLIGWRYDTTLLQNRVVINSNTRGTSDGVAEDGTSIGTNGLRELPIPTRSNNSADNKERAVWEVARRRSPRLRLERIGSASVGGPEEETFRTVELQDLVEASRRPGAGQDDLTVRLRVASIVQRFAGGGHRWGAELGMLEADTDLPAIYDDGFVYDDPASFYGY